MRVHLIPNGDDLDFVAECQTCGWVSTPAYRPQDVDTCCKLCEERRLSDQRWMRLRVTLAKWSEGVVVTKGEATNG